MMKLAMIGAAMIASQTAVPAVAPQSAQTPIAEPMPQPSATPTVPAAKGITEKGISAPRDKGKGKGK